MRKSRAVTTNSKTPPLKPLDSGPTSPMSRTVVRSPSALASHFSTSEMANRFQCIHRMERAESKAATCFLYRQGVIPAQRLCESLRLLKAKRTSGGVRPRHKLTFARLSRQVRCGRAYCCDSQQLCFSREKSRIGRNPSCHCHVRNRCH